MTNYPTISLDPRRRRMAMFPNVIPVSEDVQDGAVPEPTVRRKMYAPENQPVPGPREQMAQNVEASVPPITARSRMAPDSDGENDPDLQPVIRRSGYDEFAQKGEAQQRLEDLQRTGAGKAKGDVLSRLKALGMTLAEGRGSPLADALNPQGRQDRMYQVKEAQATQEAETESRLRGRRMNEMDSIAQQTGRLPGTQEPTEPARHRMAQEQETTLRNRQVDEDRDAERQRKISADANKVTAQKIRTQTQLAIKGMLSPKDKATFANSIGVSGELADAYIAGEAETKPDEQGRLWIVHKRGGYREPVLDPDTGRQMVSFETTKEKGRNSRAAVVAQAMGARLNLDTDKFEWARTNDVGEAQGRLTKAQRQLAYARSHPGEKDSSGNVIYTPEFVQSIEEGVQTAQEQVDALKGASGASGKAGSFITRAQYNKMVTDLGQDVTDTTLTKRGVKVRK